MNIPKFLSSNFPTYLDTNGVKIEPNLSSRTKQSHVQGSSGTHLLDQEHSEVDAANSCSTSPLSAAPVIRQFWKAGVYNDEITPKSTTQYGSSYLHIHPRFLHSNATSHKWVFGAIAELIDNAVDEIQNGATFVIIDKTTNPRNGSSALLIQDDGGGMCPEAMRRCLSFGFSDKKSISTIGKYGNGFKTSTMRLGADVIVFTRNHNQTNGIITQSIGLLSYTFLTRAGYNRVVVPMVHYEFNFATGSFDSLQSQNNENSNLNLSLMLQWSPYSTEKELLEQFEDVGQHGTKVIVYNLWLDEDGNMELDFESDPEDIRITRDAHGKMKDGSREATSEQHIANRLRYSLHAYLSILYLKLPESFAMILRGKVVLYHNVATDLKFTEFIVYKPYTSSFVEEVTTTIGFIKEAPLVNVHGFNVYHKNRLILPFWPVVSFSRSRGRGVVGILEANFIEPTHDKQDFEKTSLYQKLAQRLKEMTWEYWDYHCGLIGYQFQKKVKDSSASVGPYNFVHHHGTEQPALRRAAKSYLNSNDTFGLQEGSNLKRKSSDQSTHFESRAQMKVDSNKTSNMPGSVNSQGSVNMKTENTRLRFQDSHGGVVGGNQFTKKALAGPNSDHQNGLYVPVFMSTSSNAVGTTRKAPPLVTTINSKAAFESNHGAKPSQQTGFQQGSNLKRAKMEVNSSKGLNMSGLATKEANNAREKNRRLRSKCREFQMTQEQLKLKVAQLKMELGTRQAEYARMLNELQYLENM